MHPVWAQRRVEIWNDCLVSPDVFQQMGERLAAFVVSYQDVLETEASQRNVPRSLQGLLSYWPGKNAEDSAPCVHVERQVSQDCSGPGPWEQRPGVTV